MIYAVMFHHFHGNEHTPSQGSISSDQLEQLLDYLKTLYTILSPEEYAKRIVNKELTETEICLTFDDALKCQYDIALPVLNKFGFKAFFFVYTSALSKQPDELEFYRDFRTNYYANINAFYLAFFDTLKNENNSLYKRYQNSYPDNYLSHLPFYTNEDRRFRFIRDNILGPSNYHQLMKSMMNQKGYNCSERLPLLFMTQAHLKSISNQGHTIGLHSSTHPTRIDELPKEAQFQEYKENLDFLTGLLGKKIWSMSHPCGRYNQDTLNILNALGINIGFRCSLSVKEIKHSLEIPRENHANLMKYIK